MAVEMTRKQSSAPTATGGGERAADQRMRPLYRPRADIYETDESIVVLADMPGVAPDGIDVTLERGVLTIRGRVPDLPHEGYRRVYAEYQEGDFERSFTLSEHIDADRIEARMQDGVLTLALPKAEPARSRRIEVKAA